MPQNEPYILDDVLWEQLIELTDGEAALCYQCGECTAACPWGLVRQEYLSVRTLMRQAQLGLFEDGKSAILPQQAAHLDLWLCTNCAQCQAYCPRGVDISRVIRALRAIAWERRQAHAGLPTLLWSLHWNGNPWSQPPSQRAAWSKGLDLPAFDPDQHEVLLYVGCTSSYDRRLQKIARSLVAVLRAAGVSFGYLGDEEPCCGEAALSIGHEPYFQEIARQTAQRLQEKGVRELISISPHCYHVFRNHYPAIVGEGVFTARHYTQYLAGLVDGGRLEFKQALQEQVTFHDPCYLGRHNGEYAAPRHTLAAIPGLELVEMEKHGIDSLCCGGGGGRMWLETKAGERFSDLRVEQARETQASILAAACPFCVACLEDSLKASGARGLRVLDVAEIAASAL
ncbi:MAG: (Fe-S)-binding protein [Anaerolineales bacterium]|nr:(Fe-S)-binding protein [Anaerolineales bacterium]